METKYALNISIPLHISAVGVSELQVICAVERELNRVLNERTSSIKDGVELPYKRKCFFGETFDHAVMALLRCTEHDSELQNQVREKEKELSAQHKMRINCRATAHSNSEERIQVSISEPKVTRARKQTERVEFHCVNDAWIPVSSPLSAAVQMDWIAKRFGATAYYGGICKMENHGIIQHGHWVKVKARKSEIEGCIKYINSEAGMREVAEFKKSL